MSHHSHMPPELDEKARLFVRKHKRSIRLGCLVAGILISLLSLVLVWGLFHAAFYVKDWVVGKGRNLQIPLEWEKPLGDAALAQLRIQHKFSTDRQVLDPLHRLAAPLFELQTNSPARFTLFVTESKEINALALPGGYLVFHRGLLERARSAEEIQGVIAHEMAHVQLRHCLLQLAQNIGLEFALDQILGGQSGLLDALVRDSGKLINLKFSRDHERAADDLGWNLLEKARINPQGMAKFFEGLISAGADSNALNIPLLSTHPAPKERLDRLHQKLPSLEQREYRTFDEDFKALQSGLGLALERP